MWRWRSFIPIIVALIDIQLYIMMILFSENSNMTIIWICVAIIVVIIGFDIHRVIAIHKRYTMARFC